MLTDLVGTFVTVYFATNIEVTRGTVTAVSADGKWLTINGDMISVAAIAKIHHP